MFPAPVHWTGLVHGAPLMLQVPVPPHVLSVVHDMVVSFEQRPPHVASLRQLNPVTEQVPVRHSVDVQAKLPPQVSPLACSGVQVRVPTGAPVSQNRPFWHWGVDVHATPEPSNARHTAPPTAAVSQNSPLAQPWAEHGMFSVGSAMQVRFVAQKLSVAHS
jgi:hypothetical protein